MITILEFITLLLCVKKDNSGILWAVTAKFRLTVLELMSVYPHARRLHQEGVKLTGVDFFLVFLLCLAAQHLVSRVTLQTLST